MFGVKYVAPVFDRSGYAAASRNYILSLYRKGIPIRVTAHCFENAVASVGTEEEREILAKLVSSEIPYDIVICQLTPDMALLHKEPGKHNIVYFAWETSKVHPKWVDCINQMDTVWVPSEWNVEALKQSGVSIPIFKVPHGINDKLFDIDISGDFVDIVSKSTYMFYSIFQWQPRKNPESLLRAYINEFTPNDDVVLLVKTYIRDGSAQERQYLSEVVGKIKRDMGLKQYPKIMFLFDIMSDEQVLSLHKRSDCFVYLSHGEGWGLTPFEAGLAGNPVIATDMGGHKEFLNHENSFPVDFQWSYVHGMSIFNPWYVGSGLWADPNEVQASELMRYVFSHQDEAKQKGLLLQNHIKENFNWEKIADIITQRLNEIGV